MDSDQSYDSPQTYEFYHFTSFGFQNYSEGEFHNKIMSGFEKSKPWDKEGNIKIFDIDETFKLYYFNNSSVFPYIKSDNKIKVKLVNKYFFNDVELIVKAVLLDKELPFLFSSLDYFKHNEYKDLPKETFINTCAFGMSVTVYDDEDEFLEAKNSKTSQGFSVYVPDGTFMPLGLFVPDRSSEIQAGGLITEVDALYNKFTGLPVYRFRLKDLPFDFYLPDVDDFCVCEGEYITGEFWLAGIEV